MAKDMNQLEARLLREEVGGAPLRLSVCTRTRIDAGRWWRRTPVWLCVMAKDLVVLAVARRKYIQRIPLSECRGSHYVAATGELVIAPGEGMQVSRFALSLRDAVQVLTALKTEDEMLSTQH